MLPFNTLVRYSLLWKELRKQGGANPVLSAVWRDARRKLLLCNHL